MREEGAELFEDGEVVGIGDVELRNGSRGFRGFLNNWAHFVELNFSQWILYYNVSLLLGLLQKLN